MSCFNGTVAIAVIPPAYDFHCLMFRLVTPAVAGMNHIDTLYLQVVNGLTCAEHLFFAVYSLSGVVDFKSCPTFGTYIDMPFGSEREMRCYFSLRPLLLYFGQRLQTVACLRYPALKCRAWFHKVSKSKSESSGCFAGCGFTVLGLLCAFCSLRISSS